GGRGGEWIDFRLRGVILVFSLRFRRIAMAAVSVCSALCFGASADQAVAAIVYDNGPPSGSNGNEVTENVVANDFTLSSATSVAGGAIYIAGVTALGGVGNWDGVFGYSLFADSGSNSPGTQLTSGLATKTTTNVGPNNWPAGGDVYRIDFNFVTPFSAAAATKYWLGVHLSADYIRDHIFWVHTDNTGLNGTRGYRSQNGLFNNWTLTGYENAFYLNGTPAGGPVPEPTSLAIFGLGAVGAAYRARRKLVAG
ncbi:MAG: PEP-CTERM sorting domain-containing protein, partial [Pirellulaceae bacterium]